MTNMLLLTGWIVMITLDVTSSFMTYSFKENCSYSLHRITSSVFVNYTRETLPSDTCSVGFYTNGSQHKTCVNILSYNVEDCRLVLEFSDSHETKRVSTCNGAKKTPFCTDRILTISLHNADLYTGGTFSLKVSIDDVHNPGQNEEGGSNTHWIIIGVVVFFCVCSGGGGKSVFNKNRGRSAPPRPSPNPVPTPASNTPSQTQGHDNTACNINDETQINVQDTTPSRIELTWLSETPGNKYDPPSYEEAFKQLPTPSAPSGELHDNTYYDNSRTSNEHNGASLYEHQSTLNHDGNATQSHEDVFVITPPGPTHNPLPIEAPPRYEDIFAKTTESNI